LEITNTGFFCRVVNNEETMFNMINTWLYRSPPESASAIAESSKEAKNVPNIIQWKKQCKPLLEYQNYLLVRNFGVVIYEKWTYFVVSW
jgi:hypothetical protein